MKLNNPQCQAILLMSFSKRLAAVRKERGLTQQQMSEVIGIHLSQVLFPNLQPKEPLLFSQTTIQMPILRTTLI